MVNVQNATEALVVVNSQLCSRMLLGSFPLQCHFGRLTLVESLGVCLSQNNVSRFFGLISYKLTIPILNCQPLSFHFMVSFVHNNGFCFHLVYSFMGGLLSFSWDFYVLVNGGNLTKWLTRQLSPSFYFFKILVLLPLQKKNVDDLSFCFFTYSWLLQSTRRVHLFQYHYWPRIDKLQNHF